MRTGVLRGTRTRACQQHTKAILTDGTRSPIQMLALPHILTRSVSLSFAQTKSLVVENRKSLCPSTEKRAYNLHGNRKLRLAGKPTKGNLAA